MGIRIDGEINYEKHPPIKKPFKPKHAALASPSGENVERAEDSKPCQEIPSLQKRGEVSPMTIFDAENKYKNKQEVTLLYLKTTADLPKPIKEDYILFMEIKTRG